jgi:hypothetical protein
MTSSIQLRIILKFLGLALLAFGCGRKPLALPEDTNTHSVCEAAKSAIGDRIRVRGKIERFSGSVAAGSAGVVLGGNEICNEHGAGLIFTTLADDSERAKYGSAVPGTFIILEGTIEDVVEDRFTTLTNVIVREVE